MSTPESDQPKRPAHLALTLAALGVVFGDIGTSPLYTMSECLKHTSSAVTHAEGVLGVLSLIFWALMFEVSFKYLLFVMRADNRGEGGIFALLALAMPKAAKKGVGITTIIILAGAALLYGDGVITPAISVLGAAEGFGSLNPHMKDWVLPVAVVILAALFLVQKSGTHAIGRIFGPVMLLWFGALAALGVWHIFEAPEVFRAVNPLLGLNFLFSNPGDATAILGSLVLCITGAEALYADMGHFGRRYITRAWIAVVCPGLVLNYFGQGAWALSHPGSTANPFFELAPFGPMRVGLVILSIAAAIIASQALISGTFSLTRQAIQLGYFPRLKIAHTNAEHAGQIYLPFINWALAICTIWVVFTFKSVSGLAAAYGIAVTGTMAITSFAFFRVTRICWKWPLWKSLLLVCTFLVFDAALLYSNAHKIPGGGWLPIAIGAIVLAIMHTWKTGKNEIVRRVYGNEVTEDELVSIVKSPRIARVSGSAVFMAGNPHGTPLALLHHLKANKSLQQTVVLLSVITEEVPVVPGEERLDLKHIGEGVWRAVGRYGYMESPDCAMLMDMIRERGCAIKPRETTYYFNREMVVSGGEAQMWEWEKGFYAFLSRNARPAKDYYKIPPTQIIELGLPIQL
ncbi:MAG: KUP/HAK/KT family potassium transporter [Nibricoccus sp.]